MADSRPDPRVIEIVSFPKSGKTWTKFMLAHVFASVSGRPIEDVLSRLSGLADTNDRLLDGVPTPLLTHGRDNGLVAAGGPFPTGWYAGTRVVQLVRDPRDVVVSHYVHERFGLERFDGTFDEFLRYEPDEAGRHGPAARFGIMPIIRTLNAWATNAGVLAKQHVLSYESMREHPARELTALCRFVGVDASDDVIRQAVSACTLERMRELEASGRFGAFGLQNPKDTRGRKVRDGRVGGGFASLNDEQRRFIEDAISEHLCDAYPAYRRTRAAA